MLVCLMLLEMIESKSRESGKFQRKTFCCRQAWISLGDMSQDRAKEEFIKFLFERCPTFRLHLEAHHVENEEKDRLR